MPEGLTVDTRWLPLFWMNAGVTEVTSWGLKHQKSNWGKGRTLHFTCCEHPNLSQSQHNKIWHWIFIGFRLLCCLFTDFVGTCTLARTHAFQTYSDFHILSETVFDLGIGNVLAVMQAHSNTKLLEVPDGSNMSQRGTWHGPPHPPQSTPLVIWCCRSNYHTHPDVDKRWQESSPTLICMNNSMLLKPFQNHLPFGGGPKTVHPTAWQLYIPPVAKPLPRPAASAPSVTKTSATA